MHQPAPTLETSPASLPVNPHVLDCGIREALRLCGLAGPRPRPIWVPVLRRVSLPKPVEVLHMPRD